MAIKDKLIINKGVNCTHEIFALTEKRGREIFSNIYDRINTVAKFTTSGEIDYLYKRYGDDINEFVYAVYILGHQIRAAYENEIIITQKQIASKTNMILSKYFETDCKVH